MHRIFILVFCCLICFTNVADAMTSNEYVSAIEKKLFGMTYEKQPLSSRIDRIEMQIYNSNYAGSDAERLSKIDKIYPKSEFETGKIFPDNTYSNKNETAYGQDYDEEPADYNSYPIVSSIEKQIYKKDYIGEDIYKRLARLEKELYGHVKSDESLQSRVEALKSVLPAKTYTAKNSGSVYNNFKLNSPAEGFSQVPVTFDIQDALIKLELQAFNRTYENDKTEKRLQRLEHYYYGSSHKGLSDEERIANLSSAIVSDRNMNIDMSMARNAQWAGILMNLLIIGLGILL